MLEASTVMPDWLGWLNANFFNAISSIWLFELCYLHNSSMTVLKAYPNLCCYDLGSAICAGECCRNASLGFIDFKMYQ